jgi:hypothetical protein
MCRCEFSSKTCVCCYRNFRDAPVYIFALHKLPIKEIILNYCSFSHIRIIEKFETAIHNTLVVYSIKVVLCCFFILKSDLNLDSQKKKSFQIIMSYIGSDAEQDKPANLADFRRQRSSSNLMTKAMESSKLSQQNMWNDKQNNDDTDSEISDSGQFLAKGAFLLTPSHELTMDRAAMICEKMNFKGCFSLTKTATGILFKFSHPEDYQIVFKKGFHKVTGARFYKKVSLNVVSVINF